MRRRRGGALVFVLLLLVYVVASRSYRPWQERTPDLAAAHLRLAGDYGARGRVADAIAESQKAVRLSPDNPIAHYNLAVFLIKEGRFEEAVGALRRTIELAPSFEPAKELLARLRAAGS